jgi:hypothetical protein
MSRCMRPVDTVAFCSAQTVIGSRQRDGEGGPGPLYARATARAEVRARKAVLSHIEQTVPMKITSLSGTDVFWLFLLAHSTGSFRSSSRTLKQGQFAHFPPRWTSTNVLSSRQQGRSRRFRSGRAAPRKFERWRKDDKQPQEPAYFHPIASILVLT